MRSLIKRGTSSRQTGAKSDPAPSRWAYRMQRVLLTPMYRRLLRFGIPFCLSFGIGTWYLSDPAVQQRLQLAIADIRHQIQTRPEFMVKLMSVEGASDRVAEEVRDSFAYTLPASSFDMDLDAVRVAVEDIPAVAAAAVRVRQGGVLEIRISEREPAALIRVPGGLIVMDAEGVALDAAAHRGERPDLPVLTGAGADEAIPEALAIRAAAAPLAGRLRGLVRMGERRWDVVLDRDQRIMLPEDDPVRALERVIVLSEAQDMLERDIAAVDMRLSDRPTLRMKEQATSEWWRVRNEQAGTSAE
ncbi:cell division protein FtsQ/DivIB [Roseovarius nanhaiticus]|uniref:Cell division protein FtsQ n=1 Tax=Roseovarius nanhaiticus TaxID=573024 RepID=A0A1N7HCE9_9RHOB|nr:cell division protein FtsQ/DivIB [Roseovarius nanhaiticus]SEL02986.1 cell division protein FtsQ [Roseovarius nanhaiticus]SIS22482.1 cell division protein FtsQ [Roseovarius nanhaiticus]